MIDKYVYPGTNILINKFNCRDEKELRRIEALSTGGKPLMRAKYTFLQ